MTACHTAPGLERRIAGREARIGIIGLGYIGLPLAVAFAQGGFRVTGFDIDPGKISALGDGRSYVDNVSSEDVAQCRSSHRLAATGDFTRLADCDVIVICVPTPLSRHREPDLRFVTGTAETIAAHLRPGQLVILESTTYPGTTEDVVKPILERGGLRSGTDFYLGFSPEREDPGNAAFRTVSIPKVAAGDGPLATTLVEAFYRTVFARVVMVSSPAAAEAVKITENVFRAVNIALVNELKLIYGAMGIDVWEVIDAAATKPFGYMPFYPGPGLGGHCIPIDPFYLTWKAREFGLSTRFVELAGEINVAMPRFVIDSLEQQLDRRQRKSLGSARVLILGLAYKKNVSDIRESPTFRLMDILAQRGAAVDFHDPLVPVIPPTRDHAAYAGIRSVALGAESLAAYDAVIVSTDHDAIDYHLVAREAKLIIDTRNAFARRNIASAAVVKA
ncbi:nucleotide sugar dehydrogenase [Aestuariivirga litoralis]|uniref:Nucleotide sugar dehydrogenase n=1 Tax=Aestuariivirga litoralis TaxID=2650924 RepID=A0A2W2BZ85_9HYPH|nr:nucleotide sugar dehydrogenase [Aestuariivirga litoralis]PZF78796.1 nucleotide sugar dehydrogenase [Aestuariivirga litoralis]